MKLPKLFTSSPDKVANDIYDAVNKKKDIIYTMKIWRLIMFIIRCIPERIFKNKSFQKIIKPNRINPVEAAAEK